MVRPRPVVESILRESWFWSDVFLEHAIFLQEALSPNEEQQLRWIDGFRLSFEPVATETRRLAESVGVAAPAGAWALTGVPAESPLAALQGPELARYEQEATRLSHTVAEATGSLRAFKEQLLRKKLDCNVGLAFSPSVVLHMIWEADEAQRNLMRMHDVQTLPPVLETVHQHLLWLPGTAGHAAIVAGGLDGRETELRARSLAFQDTYDHMNTRALELYSMIKDAPRMVGALKRLGRDAMKETEEFGSFLAGLRDRIAACEVMTGFLPALLADHMLREELYYIEKVNLVTPAEPVD